MPYATCPNCKSTFHLRVVEDIENWNKKFPVSEDGIRYIECFDCWRELKELDSVQVWNVPNEYKDEIKKGDIGAVVLLHGNNVFEVECVNEDGSTKWQFAIPRKYLKYVRNKPANKALQATPKSGAPEL